MTATVAADGVASPDIAAVAVAPSASTRGNLLAVYSSLFVSKIAALVMLGYAARVLGPSGFGLAGWATAAVAYAAILLSPGLNTWGTRAVAQRGLTAGAAWVTVNGVQFLLALAAYAILATAAFVLVADPVRRAVLLVAGLGLFTIALSVDWLFQGLERMAISAIMSAFGAVVYAVALVAIVRGPEHVLPYVGLRVGVDVLVMVAATTYLFRAGVVGYRSTRGASAAALRSSLPLVVSASLVTVLQYANTLILDAVAGAAAVGLFVAGLAIFMQVKQIRATAATVILPRLSRLRAMNVDAAIQEALLTARVHVFAGAALAGLIALEAPAIIHVIYGERYAETATVLRILAFAVFTNFVICGYTNCLIPFGRDRAMLRALFASAALAVVGGLVMVPRFGIAGAAVVFASLDLAGWLVTIPEYRRVIGSMQVRTWLRASAAVVAATAAWFAASSMGFGGLFRATVFLLAFVAVAADRNARASARGFLTSAQQTLARWIAESRSSHSAESVARAFALPRHWWSALLLFQLLALALHVLPQWGSPHQSDTQWIFRLMAAPGGDAGFVAAIPQSLRDLGAFPQNPVAAFPEWHNATGRANILDLIGFWTLAAVGGANATVWHALVVIGMALGVSLLYMLLLRLRVQPWIALLAAIAVLVGPFEIWGAYNTSEHRAAPLLMAGLYVALRRGSLFGVCASAALLLAAVLAKETFLAGWFLVPALAIARRSTNDRAEGVGPRTELTVHSAAILLFVLWTALWNVLQPAETSYLAAEDVSLLRTLVPFTARFAYGVVPWSLLPLAGIAIAITWPKAAWQRLEFASWERIQALVGFAALVAMAAHAGGYLLTGRAAVGRYVVPANFMLAIAAAIVVQLISARIRTVGTDRTNWMPLAIALALVWPRDSRPLSIASGVLLAVFFFTVWLLTRGRGEATRRAVTTMALLVAIGAAIWPTLSWSFHRAGQARRDAETWNTFVSSIAQTPANTRVELAVDDPLMLETAQSLQASLLLAGRRDVTVRIAVEGDSTRLGALGPMVRRQIRSLNAAPLRPGASFVRVRASRRAPERAAFSTGTPPVLDVLKSGREALRAWYVDSKAPYLVYELDQETPPMRGGQP